MGDIEQKQPDETQNPDVEEQEKPLEEQPDEPEAKGEDDGDGEPEGDQPEAEAAAESKPESDDKAEEKRRRAGGYQRKIERQERELEFLRQQLMQRQGQPANANANQNAEAKPKDPAAQAEEYISNLVAQRLAAEREQERQQRAQAEFQRRMSEAKQAHPDFDEVVMSADAPVSPAVHQALLTSEHAGVIMYQLAKNPAELARISALPPLDAAREIGRLEAKVSVTAAPPKPKSAVRPPVPPTSVGASPSSTRNLEDLPLAEYKRAMRSGRR